MTIAVKATTWPMDRSISPADRANVVPNAMTDTKAVWRSTFSWFSMVRKPLSRRVIAKNTKMPTKPM